MKNHVTNSELVDIRCVDVDKSLPEMERLIEFVRQIGDPYNFICGPYKITATYPEDAKPMIDCLRGAVA